MVDSFNIPQQPIDKGNVNKFGLSLLSMYKTHNIHMLNGDSPTYISGEYTYCSPTITHIRQQQTSTEHALRVIGAQLSPVSQGSVIVTTEISWEIKKSYTEDIE